MKNTMNIFYSVLIKFICLIVASFTLVGCQSIDMHGQFVEAAAIEELEHKKLNKEQVIELIGTPTTVPEYSPNTWYYIQRALAKRAWFEPKIIEQRIVKVTFNQNDQVEEVEVLQGGGEEPVQVVREYTKTYGTELNPAQKFIKNIGRFNKTTDGTKKRK